MNIDNPSLTFKTSVFSGSVVCFIYIWFAMNRLHLVVKQRRLLIISFSVYIVVQFFQFIESQYFDFILYEKYASHMSSYATFHKYNWMTMLADTLINFLVMVVVLVIILLKNPKRAGDSSDDQNLLD